MANRIHDLKETESSFQVRGVVTNTRGNRFYKSGTGKSGGTWNATEFGVKIGENKTVFCTLNGFPRPEVFYYKKGENGAKGTTQKVAWKDWHKSPGEGFKLIGINISTGKDENGKNVNKTFTEFDAVEWIHDNLKDGDNVFIKGTLRFSSYTDRNGQTKKKIELVPTQISYTQKPVDFNEDSCAEFVNTIVFSAIDRETDEHDKRTGRFVLSGYSVGYNTIEPVSFIIGKEDEHLASGFKRLLKPGNAINVYGRVDVVSNVSDVSSDESDWGTRKSPLKRMNTPVIREYVVYDADHPDTVDKETYSEESIAAAIKKIKAAQTATENFGDKVKSAKPDIYVDDNDSGWGDSAGFDDDDTDWN